MQKLYSTILFLSIVFCLHAQNNSFVSFLNEGQTFSINNITGIKTNTELNYSAGKPIVIACIFTNPKTRDSVLLYISDENGLAENSDHVYASNAILIFVYKAFGKGTFAKVAENAKGEMSKDNFVNFTKLESKDGGIVEGSFAFADIPFKDNTNKLVARLKAITDGKFRTQINTYKEAVKNNAGNNTLNNNQTNNASLSKSAALLFKNVKTKLNASQKNKIADALGFKVSKDAKQFISDNESADYPFDAFVYPTDMNKDGQEEIFILFGNTYTSGNTGTSIYVFIADKTGEYKMNLGFPGMLPDVLATSNLGYPDLLVGGPGMEFPVFRWNGKLYDNFKTVKDSDYEKLKKTSVEDISKAYCSSLQ